MAFLFSRLLRYVILFYALFAGSQYLLRIKSYSFSPKEFRTLAEKSKGEGAAAVMRLASDLRRSFGPAIATDLSWTSFQAGGLQLKSMILHGSLTEFIVAFTAPFPTAGRSGFHYANSTCTVLSGTVSRLSDATHSDTVETFAAGANFRQGQFESSLYSVAAKTYVVCYGRGLAPVSALWALPQNVLGGDVYGAGRFVYLYGKSMVEYTAYFAQTYVDQVKKTYFKTEL